MKPAHLLLAASFAMPGIRSQAADLPPDKTTDIPASARRETVVTLTPAEVKARQSGLPKHDLPPGFTLSLAAASPLVTHPIMGCLDDRGRLFLGDGVGVNWNKAQLEASPPNRVLLLEDTDHDGVFDKSTVFADKMTFPQGACWLDGSLYVCSPPGLWKLTDGDGDGVAEKREMIVGGFDYTGNAADVHGPFLHPNGRLYWCHGRKGHKVVQKDGTLVDESPACGIWSCRPDGTDIAWHSLGCGDNPVEVDFTPEGDVIGVQNLYYNQPRGDTIVHWLPGGVYERADQLKAIAHLPRTLETMPVMYNFGHVAVSGCCFWRAAGGALAPQTAATGGAGPLHFLVTHFNTQRVVRMELTPSGSTFKAVENEFLKMHSPDIHFTDVMEDPRDGSLLVLDTGGWFRIGCPSSLMAKSDLLGAVYRVRSPRKSPANANRDRRNNTPTLDEVEKALRSSDPFKARHACDAITRAGKASDSMRAALSGLLMRKEVDPSLEHAAINAALAVGLDVEPQRLEPIDSTALRRFYRISSQMKNELRTPRHEQLLVSAIQMIDDPATGALDILLQREDADATVGREIAIWAVRKSPSSEQLDAMVTACVHLAGKPNANLTITRMLVHAEALVRSHGLQILANQTSGASNDAWLPPLEKLLSQSPTPLLLDAIKKLKSPRFDAALQGIAGDARQPLALRLKALDAARNVKLTGDTFTMVKGVLADAASSAAAKIQAAGMVTAAPLDKERLLEIAPLFATLGPVELKMLLPLMKKSKDADVARAISREIAKNPAIASQQESHYRTALADQPVDIFETIILPAYNAAVATSEAKKRLLGPLADSAATNGNAASGKKHFEAGKGTCIACHKIGSAGRPIGPDLSKIGAIRTERDLLESIIFPSNTLARDYEAHVIETADGQQITGVVKSHTAEGLLVVDVAGQEKTIPHQAITGDTTLPSSLMPQGLDQTLPEVELLDLVAYLRSLK